MIDKLRKYGNVPTMRYISKQIFAVTEAKPRQTSGAA